MNKIFMILLLLIVCVAFCPSAFAADPIEIKYGITKWRILPNGSGLIKISGTSTVSGEMIIAPHIWIVNGMPTITIPAGQTMTITIPTQSADYWLSAINISGYGGDAKITVSLPSPHYGRVARISPTEPNVNIDFGESIKIYSGTAIAIKIKSTDFEIGQVVDISWQTSSL